MDKTRKVAKVRQHIIGKGFKYIDQIIADPSLVYGKANV